MRLKVLAAIVVVLAATSAAGAAIGGPDPKAMTLRLADIRSLHGLPAGYIATSAYGITNAEAIGADGPSLKQITGWGRIAGYGARFGDVGPNGLFALQSSAETYRTSKGANAALEYYRAAARMTTEVKWKLMPTRGTIGDNGFALKATAEVQGANANLVLIQWRYRTALGSVFASSPVRTIDPFYYNTVAHKQLQRMKAAFR